MDRISNTFIDDSQSDQFETIDQIPCKQSPMHQEAVQIQSDPPMTVLQRRYALTDVGVTNSFKFAPLGILPKDALGRQSQAATLPKFDPSPLRVYSFRKTCSSADVEQRVCEDERFGKRENVSATANYYQQLDI